MGEETERYIVYLKPFKAEPMEGDLVLHRSLGKRGFDGGIAYINTETAAKRYKNVIYRSGSNITENPEGFNLSECRWYQITEVFNEMPRPKLIGRIKLPIKRETFQSNLESIAKNYLAKQIELDLHFVSSKE